MASPLVFGIESQGLTEALQRLAVLALLQQRPSAVGMGGCIIRVASQSRIQRLRGFQPAAEPDQRYRPDIGALDVFGVEPQTFLGGVQCQRPLPLLQTDLTQQRIVVSIVRIETDGFVN